MLAGLAVPLLGLTVGWRWAFGLFAVVAAVAALFPLGASGSPEGASGDVVSQLQLPRRILLVLSVGVAFAAAGGSSLAIFMVSSAVATGWDEGTAGLLFAAASVVGIGARLVSGVRADRRGRNHLWVVILMLVVGASGVAALVPGSLWLFAVGAPLAFGAGWGWPGLFILAVVRLHPSMPAAATGLTQTGTSAGCVFGPLTFGALTQSYSYATAWTATALTLLAAAAVIYLGRRHVLGYLATLPTGTVPWRDTTNQRGHR